MSRHKHVLAALIAAIILITLPLTCTAEPSEDTSTGQWLIVGSVDGNILLSENADEKRDVAGLVRLAPLLLITQAIENGDFSLDSVVTVSKKAASVPGPTAFLSADEKISARELYKSAVMIAAGDACYALSEAIFKSSAIFTEKINTTLAGISVSSTYDNPMGDGVLLSASDLYKIGCQLTKYKTFLSYSTCYMDEIIHEDGKRTELVNPNRLIRDLAGTSGLLTGSSSVAGYCGVISTVRGDASYVCVILGAKNSAERFSLCSDSIEHIYATYKYTKIAEKGAVIKENFKLSGSINKRVNLIAKDSLSVQTRSDSAAPRPIFNLPDTITAPVKAGDTVGSVDYVDDASCVVGTLELTVDADIPAVNFFTYVRLFLCAWVGM